MSEIKVFQLVPDERECEVEIEQYGTSGILLSLDRLSLLATQPFVFHAFLVCGVVVVVWDASSKMFQRYNVRSRFLSFVP